MHTKPSPRPIMVTPAIETLLARSEGSPWPANVLKHPEVIAETTLRQRLYAALDDLYRQLSDATTQITDAIAARTLRAETLSEVFDCLSILLDKDAANHRLVLYLPFEFLPPKGWEPDDAALRMSADLFMLSYMEAWKKLLDMADVRANFVDGNILEPELAPDGQPRVVKAAQLIPQLVAKGWLDAAGAKALADATEGECLRASISDALQALEKPQSPSAKRYAPIRIENLPTEIATELVKLDMRQAKDNDRGMPPLRVAWERKNNEDVLIGVYAERLAQAIIADSIQYEAVTALMTSPQPTLALAAMRGLRVAVDRLAKSEPWKAVRIAERFGTYVRTEALDITHLSDELETALAYFLHYGFVNESDLRRFGFDIPDLAPMFSMDSLFATEVRQFEDAMALLARDPEASRLLYPVAMFFGSRLKGYARRNADLDAAVFVRPGVSFAERPKIREILARTFAGDKIGGKVVEYWLDREPSGRLKVRDFPDTDVFLADSSWLHLLVSSVWFGDKAAIQELYDRLLPGFFYTGDRVFGGSYIHALWIEEMEREVLQYRLMHKGYRRFFPLQGGISSSAKGLDPESVFWDSGYRRLATKLFVSRVFFPRLSRKKNRAAV